MSSGWNTPKPVEYEGVVYPSLAALAEKYGLDKSSVSYRLKHGIPLDRPVCSGRAKACEYNGRRYASISDFARQEGITVPAARTVINLSGRWL